MKPKIKAAIQYLQAFEGAGKCPMELLNQAKDKFKLSSGEIKKLLENY